MLSNQHPTTDVAARWTMALTGPFARRRGHRPGAWWTPLGIRAGRAMAWEQAAATAIARSQGWVDDSEWAELRRHALGAAARGSADPSDERLIAAARIWLAFVDDPLAARIVVRPTVDRDPLAVALDRLAQRVRAGPSS